MDEADDPAAGEGAHGVAEDVAADCLDDVAAQIDEEGAQLSEYVRKLLRAMEYGVPYTGKTLMDRLGLKSRETFRRNYLHPAMEQGLVRMTIPDKPQSRNQRYIKAE